MRYVIWTAISHGHMKYQIANVGLDLPGPFCVFLNVYLTVIYILAGLLIIKLNIKDL